MCGALAQQVKLAKRAAEATNVPLRKKKNPSEKLLLAIPALNGLNEMCRASGTLGYTRTPP